MYVFIDFFVDYHRLSGSCMVNNWSSSCSTRDSSPPPSCWSWSSWIFFFLQSSTIWTHSIMRWQATDHYYRECAILQLQIFGIWKSSPATPKTGVWQKPVLAVGNWSRPIISQSARERKKRVKCRSGKRTRMRMGAYTSEGFLFLLYWSFYQMGDTQPVHFLIMTT